MKPKSNYMPPEQVEALINYIPQLKIKKWNVVDVVMMIKICYWLGLRIGEYLKLKAEDFDLEHREVYLGKTKTESNVYVTIPPHIMPELTNYLFDKKGSLLPGCNRFIVYHWLVKAGKALDIPALTTKQSETKENTKCHIFRKSIGKDMLYGTHTDGTKAPLNVVSASLRHTNLQTTSEYLKVNRADVKEWWDMATKEKEEIKLD